MAPSWLFHSTTSRVPSVNALACAVMLVSARGAKLATSAMNTSLSVVGELAENASWRPSRVSEKLPAIRLSGPEIRVIVPLAGSTRNRCDAVFCSPEK